MTDILQAYKDYYRVRKEQYEANPNYRNTFKSENALFEAINSCNELSEFKDKIGNLNELNAVNLTKDQYLIRKAHFDSLNETVRVLAANRILEKCENLKSAQEVITLVGEEENKNFIEISIDESVRRFYSDTWGILDDIDVYANAKVPAKYQNDLNKMKMDAIQSLRDEKSFLESNNRKFDPSWSYNPEDVLKEHHKRLVPYSDEQLDEKLNEYKNHI